MKRLVLVLSVLLTLSGASPAVVRARQSDPAAARAPADLLKSLDLALSAFSPSIGTFPSQVKDDKERRKVEKSWKTWTAKFDGAARAYPRDPEVLARACELYRMGHNLDVQLAWLQSERYGKAALAVDPACDRAHVALGLLYVNTDAKFAPDAEKEFAAVLGHIGSPFEATARQGLVFAYYYQARFRAAVIAADDYLKLHPDDHGMQGLRATAEKRALAAGQ